MTADTDFSKLKMKALKKLLKDRGESCDGCTDKSEFVARVKVRGGGGRRRRARWLLHGCSTPPASEIAQQR